MYKVVLHIVHNVRMDEISYVNAMQEKMAVFRSEKVVVRPEVVS